MSTPNHVDADKHAEKREPKSSKQPRQPSSGLTRRLTYWVLFFVVVLAVFGGFKINQWSLRSQWQSETNLLRVMDPYRVEKRQVIAAWKCSDPIHGQRVVELHFTGSWRRGYDPSSGDGGWVRHGGGGSVYHYQEADRTRESEIAFMKKRFRYLEKVTQDGKVVYKKE